MNQFLLAFIPIFVAVDAMGVLPIYVSLTHEFNRQQRSKVIFQSFWTALILALGFILVGKIVFRILGISMADFLIAGGAVLFCLSMIDLTHTGKDRRVPVEGLGAVPIGTPLIAGPAVLTTSLMMVDQYGVVPTVVAVTLNILLAVVIFSKSELLTKLLGPAGSNALSKVMALLLSAFAVMMIRKGAVMILVQHAAY
jgi:multiple antibiotic resistance protein